MMVLVHYGPVDQLATHFRSTIASTSATAEIQHRYAGFLAFSAVTAFELCYRTILTSFATRKHRVFGVFVQSSLERINGRISIKDIKDGVESFGERYSKRLARSLTTKEKELLNLGKGSLHQSYSNLLTYRHKLAHTGKMPETVTFDEVEAAYSLGKTVFDCLQQAMQR